MPSPAGKKCLSLKGKLLKLPSGRLTVDIRLMQDSVVAGSESSESVTITLRMDPKMLSRIKRLARSRYLNYQSMIKQWLGERIDQEMAEKRTPETVVGQG